MAAMANVPPEWQAGTFEREQRVGGGLSTRGACSKCRLHRQRPRTVASQTRLTASSALALDLMPKADVSLKIVEKLGVLFQESAL